jgi:hypothetical protein
VLLKVHHSESSLFARSMAASSTSRLRACGQTPAWRVPAIGSGLVDPARLAELCKLNRRRAAVGRRLHRWWADQAALEAAPANLLSHLQARFHHPDLDGIALGHNFCEVAWVASTTCPFRPGAAAAGRPHLLHWRCLRRVGTLQPWPSLGPDRTSAGSDCDTAGSRRCRYSGLCTGGYTGFVC